MRSSSRHRFLAGFTALLLVAALAGYAAHDHDLAGGSGAAGHCDLCLQLGATAGTPELPGRVQPAAEPYWFLPDINGGPRVIERPSHSHRARAPPGTLHS